MPGTFPGGSGSEGDGWQIEWGRSEGGLGKVEGVREPSGDKNRCRRADNPVASSENILVMAQRMVTVIPELKSGG